MEVLIIEDEKPAARRLIRLLQRIDPSILVLGVLDSVESSVEYLQVAASPDLLFVDIQLADGLSFDIFLQTRVRAPLVFTTAFDQYAIKAFKMNSIDYLLKPVDEEELRHSIDKHLNLQAMINDDIPTRIRRTLEEIQSMGYRDRLMVKRGQQLHCLRTKDLAYCYAEGKLCYGVDVTGNKHILDYNLVRLEKELPPRQFYRISRQFTVNIDAIKKIHTWLGGRLKLELSPPTLLDTTVSRERVNGFKEWLGQ
jgi:DNA-binding LytR/AlgR family response regulator